VSPLEPSVDERFREPYQIERELGRGGMATVYLARDLRHERPVAIKVLRTDIAAEVAPGHAEAERRLHDEEGEYYGADAVEQRRQRSWSRKPVTDVSKTNPSANTIPIV
jgi:serine/threonine protein kinase